MSHPDPLQVGGRLAAFIRAEFPKIDWIVGHEDGLRIARAARKKWPRLAAEMDALSDLEMPIDLRLELQVLGAPLAKISKLYEACGACALMLMEWKR